MDKLMKRVWILVLVVLLIVSLVACGDTSTTDPGGGVSSTPSAEVTEPSNDGTESEIPEQSEAPSESETSSGDTTDEGATAPEDDVDLPKVEF